MLRLLPLAILAAVATPLQAKPAATHHATARKVADWSRVTSATAAGGYMMGNPNAKVKLVEFGSLTCPHCRHFDEEGVTPLIAGYVRTGKVSWEFRPFLINGTDIPATLVASCNGAAGFFPMLRALYSSQSDWIGKVQAIPGDRAEAIGKMTPPQQFLAIGQAAGFPALAATRGIPAAKATACLSDQAKADRLVGVTRDAVNKDKVQGTPTFLVNGTMVDYSQGPTVWAVVQSRVDAALKG